MISFLLFGVNYCLKHDLNRSSHVLPKKFERAYSILLIDINYHVNISFKLCISLSYTCVVVSRGVVGQEGFSCTN